MPSERDVDLSAVLRLLDQLGLALRRGARADQIDIVQQLVTMRASMGTQWQALAQIAAENGELNLSREAVNLLVEACGGSPAAQYFKAGMLAETGFWQDGYELLGRLPADVPQPAENAYSRGAAALYVGKTDEARVQLERAVQLRPHLSQAWRLLSTLVDFAREPELADRLLAAEHSLHSASPNDRAGCCFALGKMRADRGEHAKAFTAFAEGSRLMKSMVKYDREQDRFGAEEAVRGYSAQTLAELSREQREPTSRTIFLTGLPRSGTSLVEQIITGHSAVTDGAEINLLRLLGQEVGGLSVPHLRQFLETDGAEAAVRLWHHWLDERFPASRRVVDKTTNASRFLGLAAALLPEAPIIWMSRDPLDCAWSCFRTYFHSGVSWSYDLADIAFHFRLEEQLLSQWQQILGDRLLVVPYEALVADSRLWIPRILQHCGLAEEPQVFLPHENPRVVNTASVMQVRNPINARSVGAAEPYRPFLEPFCSAYFR